MLTRSFHSSLLIREQVGANGTQKRSAYGTKRSTTELAADERAAGTSEQRRTKTAVAFSWTTRSSGLAVLWSAIALLTTVALLLIVVLLLMRSVLLVWIMVSLLLLLVRGERVG